MYREQIDAWIDSKQDEMIADLMSLIRIDSQKGEAAPGKPFGEGPAQVLDAAMEMMARYGLKVTDYDHYVVTGDYGTGEKELDILAHLDVVPVSKDWTVTEPFEPVIRDGRVYGRGSIDDKGPAVAALYAIRAVKELGIPLGKSLRLILGSDEECGSSDLDHYYAIEKEAPSTFTPDASFPLINLEKARLAKKFSCECAGEEALSPRVVSFTAGSKVNVVPTTAEAVFAGLDEQVLQEAAKKAGCCAEVSFTVTAKADGVHVFAKGQAAHASTPQLGRNAITAMLALIGSLELADCASARALKGLARLYPCCDTCGEALGVKMSDETSGALTMNLGILNLEDGILCGEFDVRAPLCATDGNLTEVLREQFAGIGMTMEEGKMTPAHYVPADSALVKTLLDSYEKYFGVRGEPLAIGGGTYVHDLERGVAFGVEVEGIDNHMHGDDEFIDIDILVRSAKIFADAIVNICG
ncbi:MAG: Sapep family Mn(2+)-dependent dipeptidase [Lachnospiraceae bacterium]|nr:Sapep family Mn(2+)-dependent dipeptidase [Lachnospiraceae bacterium]